MIPQKIMTDTPLSKRQKVAFSRHGFHYLAEGYATKTLGWLGRGR